MNVYIVLYTGRWHEDGFEIGGVYRSEAVAEKAGEERLGCDKDYLPNHSVIKRDLDEL